MKGSSFCWERRQRGNSSPFLLYLLAQRRSHTPKQRGCCCLTSQLPKEQNSRWCMFICGSNPIRTNYHFFGLMHLLGILTKSMKPHKFESFRRFHQQCLWLDLETGKKKKKELASDPNEAIPGNFVLSCPRLRRNSPLGSVRRKARCRVSGPF